MPSFSYHNIRLDDGTLTRPEIGFLLSESPWLLAAKRTLELTFPEIAGQRIIDLGCLEGGYTVEFARMGFEALGVEVRRNNFAACEYVKAHVDLFQTFALLETMSGISKNTASSIQYFVADYYTTLIGPLNS